MCAVFKERVWHGDCVTLSAMCTAEVTLQGLLFVLSRSSFLCQIQPQPQKLPFKSHVFHMYLPVNATIPLRAQ